MLGVAHAESVRAADHRDPVEMDALQGVVGVTTIAYLGLACLAVVQARRRRSRFATWLSVTVGMVLVALVSADVAAARSGTTAATIAEGVMPIAFAAVGWAVVMSRHSLVPYRHGELRAVAGMLVAATVPALVIRPPFALGVPFTAAQFFGRAVLIMVWVGCVLEPALRLWGAAEALKAIQRSRLRTLSVGFGTMAAILVITLLIIGLGSHTNPTVDRWFADIVPLLAVPVLYVSFAPPTWLRRSWREPEEVQLHEAIEVMLEYTPDRVALAERALEWPTRLVGAVAAFVVEPDGSILATYNTDKETAARYAAVVAASSGRTPVVVDRATGAKAMSSPLPYASGVGRLVVISGPFTPYFGPDEATRLGHHALGFAIALERVRRTDQRESDVEEMSGAKTDSMTAIAHDLRGPLAIILGYMDMLAEGTFGTLTDRQRKPLNLVTAKGVEMQHLIDDLLLAARLESGSLPVAPMAVDLRTLVTAAVTRAQARASILHATVTCAAPDTPVEVMADRNLADRVLDNVINNALAYGGNQPVVSVAVESGATPAVTVTDRGVGIRRELHGRIFERYFRATERTRHEGSGLGLFLSRQLAEAQGGSLTLRRSAPGAGSTFAVSLPGVSATDVVGKATPTTATRERARTSQR